MERLIKASIALPKVFKPIDFDEKWNKWLYEVHDVENHIYIDSVYVEEYGKKVLFYYDSVANTKIFAILYLPHNPKAVVSYYHGHNSYIEEDHNVWHCMNLVKDGLAVVGIDMRFQKGRVIDNNNYSFKNYESTLYNIDDLENSYSKRLLQDALKIIDIIKDENMFKEISKLPLILAGPSQGGGLSLMVGAFTNPDLIVCDVPSDCHIRMRIDNKHGKYGVIKDFIDEHEYLKDKIYHDIGYFDVVNATDKIKCPVFSSVGMIDNICPPSFYYLAYMNIKTKKDIVLYEGYGHGGFEEIHLPKKYAYINEFLEHYNKHFINN